jgi:hypothetical protein
MIVNSKIDYCSLLRDDELAAHLLGGHTVVFRGLGKEWHQIEKQVERLGFGDTYFVSQVAGREQSIKISPATRRNVAEGRCS